ncbi:phage tail protein [Ottowia sp.]|uniref:phage tail protein n=1 Tax=Ottowia sp. TaxID=1898956 RepID=UPI002626E4A6|nr:phage tail protein [Ottowia sp.]
MADNLLVRLKLDVVGKAAEQLKKIGFASTGTADKLRKTREAVKTLENQQKAINAFRDLYTQFKGNTEAAAGLRQHLARLKSQMGPQTAAGAKALAQEIKGAEKSLKAATLAAGQQSSKLDGLRARLKNLGVQNIASEEGALAGKLKEANAQLDAQQAKLTRLNKLRDSTRKLGAVGAAVTGGGWAARMAGMSMMRGAAVPLGQGRSYATEIAQIHALGLDKAATDGAINYAKAMKTYGTSTVDNLGLMKDALTSFADPHHAEMVLPLLTKMKFANQALFGAENGPENDRKFMDMMRVIELRGGLSSQQAFESQADVVQRVLTATGGRVGAGDWLDVIKTGGVAAKGFSDKAFYYQLEPLVQEMGGHRVGTGLMSAYQNIYQGKTTKRAAMLMGQLGLIGDQSQVKFDKVGQVAQLGVGALKGSDIFQKDQFAWMEQVLLPALAAKGIRGDKAVPDTMGGIFSNRTAANLFATMYQQRAQIHKNAQLNAGAMGVQDLFGAAKESPSGKELELLARKNDLYTRISNEAMPTYLLVLEKTAKLLERVNGFAERNPGLTKTMAVGFGALGVGLAVIGTLAIPLGLVLAKVALMRYVFAQAALGVGPFMRIWGLLRIVAGGALGLLKGGILKLIGVARSLGTVFAVVGRAALGFLLSPLGLALAAVTALAVGAWYLWKNWDTIGPKMAAFYDTYIASPLGKAWDWIRATWNEGLAWMQALTGRMWQAGSDMIDGLIRGITSKFAALKSTVIGAAQGAAEWFKEKLGIHSPSRVFMQLGENIPQGAALGIQRGTGALQAAALAMAALPGPGIAGGPLMAAAAPIRPMDSLAASVSAGGLSQTNYVTIQAAPGQDPKAIARAVGDELDRRARRERSRVYSQLSDID